ncbi:MAG: hypothetical protein SPH79_03750 [Schaalia hyovaginalis]|uniref:hypothetical protein n=1 Tax=Schaalia TaxID=2529408 RepID=UPI002A919B46|nr:hypothetical protein [Schaalia hyovaginalis]MDY6213586.1 hypothetical protein [Schaalia hyovaginalis]
MCRPVSCKVCGKTTWAGCGQHVDSVKAGVPAGQWCPGHTEEEKSAASAGSGFFSWLTGGRK